MILTITGTEQQLNIIDSVIKFLVENTTDIEKGIGTLILIGGVLLGILNGVVTFFTIMSSYNVEIAFMTKREQWKHKIINVLTILVPIWVLYIIYGLLSQIANGLDDIFMVGGIGILLILLVIVIFLLLLMGLHRKLYEVHVYRMVCLFLKRVLTKLQGIVHRVVIFFSSVLKHLVSKLRRLPLIQFMCNGFAIVKSFILELWESSEQNSNKPNRVRYEKSEILRIIAFVDILILGLMLNCYWAAYEKEYNLFATSTLMTILTFEALLLLINFTEFGNAKIYYYNPVLKKDVFIFFRYNEQYCLGGDVPKMGECEEYYMISYETIQEEKLYPLSRRKYGDLSINGKHVVMQANNEEFIMDNVLEQVKKELESHKVSQRKMDTTQIYIKLADRKVYYVVPEEVSGNIDL